MGVTVTFIAVLELVREGLIDIVQQEPFAPLHVRAAVPGRRLQIVAGSDGTHTDTGTQAEAGAGAVDVATDTDELPPDAAVPSHEDPGADRG